MKASGCFSFRWRRSQAMRSSKFFAVSGLIWPQIEQWTLVTLLIVHVHLLHSHCRKMSLHICSAQNQLFPVVSLLSAWIGDQSFVFMVLRNSVLSGIFRVGVWKMRIFPLRTNTPFESIDCRGNRSLLISIFRKPRFNFAKIRHRKSNGE